MNSAQIAQFITQGYVVAPGLIAPDVVASVRQAIFDHMGVDPPRPETWPEHAMNFPPHAHTLTVPCRTPELEQAASELVGPNYLRGELYSPFLDRQNLPPMTPGFIPVVNFPRRNGNAPDVGPSVPEKGSAQDDCVKSDDTPPFEPFPHGDHVDGLHGVTLWPVNLFVVVLVYLTDVAPYGGALAVRPGSHRLLFERWYATAHTHGDDLPAVSFADLVPVPGQAGDVVFLHYLCVHSSSRNHSSSIRLALNSGVGPDPVRPYHPKSGLPHSDWTPLDWTLRTDDLPPAAPAVYAPASFVARQCERG